MASQTPEQARGVNTALYALDEDEAAFFKQQTGITDNEELKKHIIAVAEQAHAVR